MKVNIIYLLVLMVMGSCMQRNLTYLSDLEDEAMLYNKRVYTEEVTNLPDPLFQPNDLISISVTSLNYESNTLFNRGEIVPVHNATSNGSPGVYQEGYLVDKEGYIDFPVLGRLKVGGLSKSELKANLTQELKQYLKDPIVNIRYLNYRITVIGEVNRPGTFTIPSENITVLEALGMAGDMTAFGKRENVLIIRHEDGVRKVTRLNLNNSDVLDSPYFFLKQNDVLYIEAVRSKAEQASTTRSNISLGLSVVSIITLILTRFL
ncbi:polysaccharide biosynthesis/export family protein [Cesiribacter sp. SM1]|uniref:polysaccharide biosynthesis/export family protein n=1 Tax=Cesiribacter sp. SM1 TaxID=2861196 RepID=UPI001CD3DBDF|nr:polysaccharide biosynthesis/export family protein [Cesiribacter sp. SM1]